MRIDTGQHIRMAQQMKLAPRMIQSMEILQMPQQALEARIEQELVSNPTLELAEPTEDAYDLKQEQAQTERDDRENERELVVHDSKTDNNVDDFERLANLSEDYGNDWESSEYETGESFSRRQLNNQAGEHDGKMDAMANTSARSASLYDQLIDQWRMVETTPNIFTAGEYLIGYIDADGYIRTEDRSLITQRPGGVTEQDIYNAWALLKEVLDPPGLAAKDLRECLLLQIDAKEATEPDVDLSRERLLVTDYLKDIEANRLPRIAQATGLTINQINEAKKNLRQFHPHPGKLLANTNVPSVTPEIFVEYDDDKQHYVAQLAVHGYTNLQINSDYLALAADKQVDKRTRDFVKTNERNARWLIDAIAQRHATLLRVAQVVVETQQDFFEQGPQSLKPLPMTQVADQLGIHVATVSRAVSEKYLQCPRGIYPLRMFFSGGTETESGESMSWQAVQAKLKELIDAEDKSKPLSDDALAEEMKSHGIDIARRTVAKYRKQLNIGSARQRREY